MALLELENAFLLNYLQRVAHGSLEEGGAGAADSEAAAAAAADAALPREPLLLAEKQELCAVQAVTTRREAEAVQAQGELERSVAAAAAADAQGYQTAEVARDLAALLDLLGLPEPTSEAAAVYQQATSAADQAASAAQPAESAAAGTAAAELRLPTAKQLSKADLNGPRLQEFLEGLLARHGAAAARLQQRTAMLKVGGPGGGRGRQAGSTEQCRAAAGARSASVPASPPHSAAGSDATHPPTLPPIPHPTAIPSRAAWPRQRQHWQPAPSWATASSG